MTGASRWPDDVSVRFVQLLRQEGKSGRPFQRGRGGGGLVRRSRSSGVVSALSLSLAEVGAWCWAGKVDNGPPRHQRSAISRRGPRLPQPEPPALREQNDDGEGDTVEATLACPGNAGFDGESTSCLASSARVKDTFCFGIIIP